MKGEKPPAVPSWTIMDNTKIPARTSDTGTEKVTHPRLPDSKHFSSLSGSEVAAIELCQDMLGEKLLDIKLVGKYTALDLCDLLSPYVDNPAMLSRIGVKKTNDKRHINLRTVIAMRRVFGISIDEIVDECFQSLEPRKPLK